MTSTVEHRFKSETLFRQFYKSMRFTLLTLCTDEALGSEICATLFLTGLVVTGEETINLLKLPQKVSEPEVATFRQQIKSEPINFLKKLKQVIHDLNVIAKEKQIKVPEAVVYHSRESYEDFSIQYPDFASVLNAFEAEIREYI